jgi:hypothetical protein
MKKVGDTIYGDVGGTPATLTGNITTTRKFLTQIGNGTSSSGPAWNTIASSDLTTPLITSLASPPAIGGTSPNTAAFTTITSTTSVNVASGVAILQNTNQPLLVQFPSAMNVAALFTNMAVSALASIDFAFQTSAGYCDIACTSATYSSSNFGSVPSSMQLCNRQAAGTILLKPAGLGDASTRLSASNTGIYISTVGYGTASAALHLAAGSATSGSAPIKLTSGTNTTVAVAGQIEYDGTNLYFTPGSTRQTVALLGTTTTTAPSAGAGSALPATPAGYVTVTIAGNPQQMAYF